MNKKIIFGLLIVFALLIFSFVFYLFRSTTEQAYILSLNGSVSIIRDSQNIEPYENMNLKENDLIKTGDTGEATIVLFESVIVDIDPNSEVELQSLIKDNLKLKQNSGTTWNKFLNTLGISNYEVDTPEGVAIVRGTEFKISLENNQTTLLTSEGKVEFQDKLNKRKEFVSQDEILFFKNNNFSKRTLTPKEKEKVLLQKKKLLDNLKKIRVREVEKKDPILDPIKDKFKVTHEKTIRFINDLDSGRVSEDKVLDKIPIKTKSVDKMLKYNEAAREIIQQINELNKTLNLKNNLEEERKPLLPNLEVPLNQTIPKKPLAIIEEN